MITFSVYSKQRSYSVKSANDPLCFVSTTCWCFCFCLQMPVFMAALRSRCGHYIFALWFLSFFFCFLA